MPSDYPKMQTIKYFGNKTRLLDFIIPLIEHESKPGDLVIDLFAGTCSVSYALKQNYRIITNDVEAYSKVIASALIENNTSIDTKIAHEDLDSFLQTNLPARYTLFEKTYADTFFTKKQSRDIDSIRFAIDKQKGYKKQLYLVALMTAMSYCTNSPGHFAEYLKNNEYSKDRSIMDYFFARCNTLKLIDGNYTNKAYSYEYKEFFNRNRKLISKARIIYADPPYSSAHYSRYYHLLNTLIKYDWPKVSYKARYRDDRFLSNFSRKSKVKDEFEALFDLCSSKSNATLFLSYLNGGKGLLNKNELLNIAKSYYPRVSIKIYKNYKHSMNGNGSPKVVEEVLLICK